MIPLTMNCYSILMSDNYQLFIGHDPLTFLLASPGTGALTNVFGDRTNTESLFHRYGRSYIEHSDYQDTISTPKDYTDDFFSPNFYTCTDTSASQRAVCTLPDETLNCDCLHDMRAVGNAETGRLILESERHYEQLKKNLSEFGFYK